MFFRYKLNEHFSIATILDHRFKMFSFNKELVENVKASTMNLIKEKKKNNTVLNSSEDSQKKSHEVKLKLLLNSDRKNKKPIRYCLQKISISTNAIEVDEGNKDDVSEIYLSVLQELENIF